MPKVIFYTYAYNAEKTVERTIQSVLNQTHRDLVHYVVDNGSTDRTGSIIRAMAKKDPRVICRRNQKNNVWEKGNSWREIVEENSPEDYFCFIDADDTYKPEFASRMLAFVEKNDLDVAACGNDFLEAESGKLLNVRKLPSDLVIEGKGFSEHFVKYHQFIRTRWAKLILIKQMRGLDMGSDPALSYGGDTVFMLALCQKASRIGVLAESFYQYYVSTKSLSWKVKDDRVYATKLLYSRARSFLQEKCGPITPQNQDFLQWVFFNDMRDTLMVILRSNIPVLGDKGKLAFILEMFDFPASQQLIANKYLGLLIGGDSVAGPARTACFKELAEWLYSLTEVDDEHMEGFCRLGELLCAAVEDAEKWVYFQKIRIQFLIDQERIEEAQQRIVELAELGISYFE